MDFSIGTILTLISLISLVDQGVQSLKPNSVIQFTDQNQNSEQCFQRAIQLDRCLPKLVFYGDRNFEPPRNELQLDQHCRVLDDNLKCVSSYSRECLPTFARNLYSVMIRRMKTQFAKRCKSAEGRKDFLNMMACAEAKYMEPSHRCMDAFVAHLEHIGQGGQSRQIELTCCTFQLFQECIFTASKNLKCPHRVLTADKAISYVKTIIDSMGGDMMDFMCGRYDKLSNCQAGYPAMMSQFGQITTRVQNGTMRAQSKSPLKPLLQLFISGQDE